jgi:hypothetical protein
LAKYSTTATFNASPDAVMAAVADVLQRDFHIRATQIPGGLSGSIGISLLSWGEKLSVTVDGTGPQGTAVTVNSKSAVVLQFIDYGKNRRNVQKLLRQLTERLAPSTAGGGTPAAGPPGAPVQ